MKRGRKPIKERVKNKVIALTVKGKTENQILQVIPSISSSSVQKIRRTNSELIEAEKRKYIKLINSAIGGDKKQAEVLGECLTAETEIYNFKGEIVGTRPDHKTRLDTIKYIDKLKGRDNTIVKQTQNNMFIGQQLDKYIK